MPDVTEMPVLAPPTGLPPPEGASRTVRVVTLLVERHNGTDSGRSSRKGRKRYEFSKTWDVHVAATRFSYFTYNSTSAGRCGR